MTLERELKIAISTGKVIFGSNQTEKAVKEKSAKLVVLSQNCPNEFLKSQREAKVLQFPGDNVALGAACGKPFSISAIAVVDPGESAVLSGQEA